MDAKELTELRDAARAVIENGHQHDVGGGDVFISTCDAAERLERAIAALPSDTAQAPTRYFVHDNDCGYEEFATDEERDKAHQAAIDGYLDDGWSEEVTSVVSGIVTHKTVQVDLERKPNACAQHPEHDNEDCAACETWNEYPNHDFDTCCKYEPAQITAPVAPAAAAPNDEQRPAKSHCQNGGDVCLAGNRHGICCPEDSCDIDDGVRKDPTATRPDARAMFEAWAKPRGYDLTRCTPVPYAAYKSDFTNGALAGWFGAHESPTHLSTDSVDKPVQIHDQLQTEIARLNAIINTPHSNDFLRAVSVEAEHQRQRWGSDHDGGKTATDWFWLIGYLGGKALHAHVTGNMEKAEHHVITTAAACANWHLALFGKTDMRPGVGIEKAGTGDEA